MDTKPITLGVLAISCILALSGCIVKPATTTAAENITSKPASPAWENISENPQPTYQQAPAIINANSDCKTVHVNLVKFTGSVPSSDIDVTVNDIPAVIDQDGNYYVFLDLTPGINKIEIKTGQGTSITSNSITLTFSPPLTVNLNWPHYDRTTDYSKVPLTITGSVSNSQAIVKVNGMQLNEEKDGSFIFRALGTPIEAVATLGDEIDTDSLPIFVSTTGRIGVIPGVSIFRQSRISTDNYSVDLAAGETNSLNLTYKVLKDIEQGTRCRFTLDRVGPGSQSFSQEGLSANYLPMVSGLDITMEPSEFAIYNNTIYHPTITIRTTHEVAPGTYQFIYICWLNDKAWTDVGFTINVKP